MVPCITTITIFGFEVNNARFSPWTLAELFHPKSWWAENNYNFTKFRGVVSNLKLFLRGTGINLLFAIYYYCCYCRGSNGLKLWEDGARMKKIYQC